MLSGIAMSAPRLRRRFLACGGMLRRLRLLQGARPGRFSSLMKSDWVPPGAVSSDMVWRLFWNDLRDARAGGEHCFGFAGGDGLGGKMGCGKNMDSIFY
ncbi:hypothetical protein X979_3677 [Burkholderia pseudomallei MSHR7527]|nr:hypothetical protein X979_3677 [Burkholderia pseudomallei MSHR7527]